jgi:hypothetical protein
MALEEGGDAVLVLLGQQRAGDIDQAAARLHEVGGVGQHAVLLDLALGQLVGRQAPLGVGVATPGARAGAGRVDEDHVQLAFQALQRLGLDRRADLQVADPCPLAAPDGVGQAAGVAVVGEDLTGVAHGGGQREGLAAATGAEVQHLLALDLAGRGGRDLRAQVLHLEPALGEGRHGLDRRGAIGGAARECGRRSPARRPARRRSAPRPWRRARRRSSAVLMRRSTGARSDRAAISSVVGFAQCAGQEAAPASRDSRQPPGAGASASDAGLASARVSTSVNAPGPCSSPAASAMRSATTSRHGPARPAPRRARCVAHHPAQRALAAQGVQHQARDEGAILGARVARALAPALQRHPYRKMPRLDLGQNLDRR